MVTRAAVDVSPDRVDAQRPESGRPGRQRLCDVGVRFLSDLPRAREVVDFATASCERLGVSEPEDRALQLDDALLRYHFGGRMVVIMPWGDAVDGRAETAILADAPPSDTAAIRRRLDTLGGLLTAEERGRISIQIVPRWYHERPGIVSPLTLQDHPGGGESSTRALGTGAAAVD